MFIHEIWLKYVLQIPSFALVPTLCMGANSTHETGSTAHVLYGEAHNQDAHLTEYFVGPSRHLELPSLHTLFPLAIHHRRYRLDWANAGCV